MPNLTIGIDTGGTYTDAVVIDPDTRTVIAQAKSITTHGNLADGVSQSLGEVLRAADTNFAQHADTPMEGHIAGHITQVSLSTTLATNALVEGRGSSIGVMLIGFSDAMTQRTGLHEAIPDAHIVSVKGGHRHDGFEQAPLDEDAIRKACADLNVDAFAVASHYAVRNPAHERRAAQLIHTLTGLPVSASCDLSDSLNGPLRALTAALNSRIISLIVDLKNAVANSMRACGIDAPIMIVKGDGSIAIADSVIESPIETILSGPAASVIGARYLTELSDFVVADMGGTTTDVATVVNGWPSLSPRGADIGGFHTLVKAIDMQTIGLGGDSHVDLDESNVMTLSSTRVVPIAMLAAQHPVITSELEAALGARSGMKSALDYLVLNVSLDGPDVPALTSKEQQFLRTLHADRPTRVRRVVNGAADRSCMKSLTGRGVLRRSGFTPSDAAHVLGLQGQWSAAAATIAAELLCRASYRGSADQMEAAVHAFCRDVIDQTVTKSTGLLLHELSGVKHEPANTLAHCAAGGQNRLRNLSVQFTSTLPIVAVGGPAAVFYPEVGARLNAATHVPTHSGVANAIGAAVGIIRSEYTVEITLSEDGGYRIHAASAPVHEHDATRALALATTLAREQVKAAIEYKGGKAGHIDIDVQRIQLPDTTDDSGLIGARVTARSESLAKQNK